MAPFPVVCGGIRGPGGLGAPGRAVADQCDRAVRDRRLHPAGRAAPRLPHRRVAPDSAAAKDRLLPHDVIVKVDGEIIRNLEHLRAVLAEAYADDGEVTITYVRGGSLVHHDLPCNVKKTSDKADGRRRKAEPGDVDADR